MALFGKHHKVNDKYFKGDNVCVLSEVATKVDL